MIKKVFSLLAVLVLLAVPVMAQDEGVVSYNQEDTSAYLRMKYSGSESTATWTNSTSASIVTIGTDTYTFTFSGTDTVAAVKGYYDKQDNLRCFYVNGLAADAPDGDVVVPIENSAIAIDLSDNQWHEVLVADTTEELHFSTTSYGQGGRSGTYGTGRYLKWIYGNCVGTGDITVNVYVDGVEKFEKVIVSPGTTGANTNLNDVVTVGQLNIVIPGKGIYVGPTQRCLVRATMASTATSGSIGAMYKNR